ncbi:MAG: aminoglycoside phosphotransferase family protein [Acidobacteriaceae bacterium]|nr:aminoglycoside phosphotransferase family protein [Acidobacteriaceae bacterium]MBV9500842.1 aminoglycoside phosphotransferase family protein [Acidobacteriaceae bacterium]
MGAVSELAPISEGEESQAYRFRSGTRAYVLRLNPDSVGFQKDAFVYRTFAPRDLPVPKVIRIGEIDHQFYCISESLPGVTLQELKREDLPLLLGPTAQILELIAKSDLGETSGFGTFDKDGTGTYESWRNFLSSIADRDRYNWEAVGKLVDSTEIRRSLTRLVALAGRCPETRALVHGDFGSNNVLTDGRRITGVIDWSEALFGDPLYDVANTFYWRTWLDCMEEQARYFEAHLDPSPALSDRLLCYQLRIGLAEIYQNAVEGKVDGAAWAASRCRELIR